MANEPETTEDGTTRIETDRAEDEGLEVGTDGKNPVTPNNPLPKAQAEEFRGEPREGQDANEFEPHVYPTASESDDRRDPSDNDGDGEDGDAPAKSASKADWVTYAQKQDSDLSDEDAEKMTRDELARKYGS